jgi:peptidyl-prolyl cis-trans isomerase C
MNVRASLRFLGLAALAIALPMAISAAGNVIAQGTSGLNITVDDMNADALRLPPAARSQALRAPDAVQQTAQNLYVRRVLAAEAVRDGLDKDPTTAALIQIARERILSDARLAKIDDANRPQESAVEAGARTAYNAQPQKFRTEAQARARHIFVMGTNEGARAAAQKMLDEVKAGADFAQVAKDKSMDFASAANGGDLGWFEPGQGRLDPAFEAALSQLKEPGEYTQQLVRTEGGFHIIRLEGRRPAGQRTFEEVREELRAQVRGQLQSDARLREVRRIAEGFKPDRPAIEAFSAAHRQ